MQREIEYPLCEGKLSISTMTLFAQRKEFYFAIPSTGIADERKILGRDDLLFEKTDALLLVKLTHFRVTH